MRLSKFLAHAGYCSRREAEKIIKDDKVIINDVICNDFSYQVDEKDIVFIVPAEGTRKWVKKWKTGFYHIAKKANVPVLLGYLDYKTKTSGINKIINLSDSFENDMNEIQAYYLNYTGKFPENYNPSIY